MSVNGMECQKEAIPLLEVQKAHEFYQNLHQS